MNRKEQILAKLKELAVIREELSPTYKKAMKTPIAQRSERLDRSISIYSRLLGNADVLKDEYRAICRQELAEAWGHG